MREHEKEKSEFFSGQEEKPGKNERELENRKPNHLHLRSSGMATMGTFALDFLVFLSCHC